MVTLFYSFPPLSLSLVLSVLLQHFVYNAGHHKIPLLIAISRIYMKMDMMPFASLVSAVVVTKKKNDEFPIKLYYCCYNVNIYSGRAAYSRQTRYMMENWILLLLKLQCIFSLFDGSKCVEFLNFQFFIESFRIAPTTHILHRWCMYFKISSFEKSFN